MGRYKPRHSQSGQAVLEFTVVFVFLLLVLVGIVGFGQLFNHSIMIQNAAREGAREGALGKADLQIKEAIRRTTSALDENRLRWKITPPDGDPDRKPGELIKVEVWYDDHLPIPILSSMANPRTLYAQATMRIQNPYEE